MQAGTTVTDLRYMASLLTVSFDVLVECILVRLPVCALIACHMVCKGLCKAAKRALENASDKFIAQTKPFLISCKHQEVILSAFEHGTKTFLRWIETVMKYPLFASEPVDLIHCAGRIAARGDISMLEYFWDTIQGRRQEQTDLWFRIHWYSICTIAAQHNHLRVLQWIHKNHLLQPIGDNHPHCLIIPIVSQAASAGHLPILQWLYENAFPVNIVKTVKKAAANGHIAVVEWACKQTSYPIRVPKYGTTTFEDLTDIVCISSCAASDTMTLKWALGKGFRFPAGRCLAEAMLKGNVPMAEHIRTVAAGMSLPLNLSPEDDCLFVQYAVQSNSIETLQWLHNQVPAGYFQSRDPLGTVVSTAAESSSLEVLQWTLANGYKPNDDAIHSAVVNNQAQNLRWMLQDDRFSVTASDERDFSDHSLLEILALDTVQALSDCGLATPSKETLCACKLRQTKYETHAWMDQRIGRKAIK